MGPLVHGDARRETEEPALERPAPALWKSGERANLNPPGISLRALIAEDYRTHGRSLASPGFWAVACHRLMNWKAGIRYRLLRAPFTLLVSLVSTFVIWILDIEIPYGVRLGRRVHLWHHGGMKLGAQRIGDDVQLRHNTTFGVAHTGQDDQVPVIGDRVDIGPGVCVLGRVHVGDDAVLGANSVVLKDVPPKATVFGIPARRVDMSRLAKTPTDVAQR